MHWEQFHLPTIMPLSSSYHTPPALSEHLPDSVSSKKHDPSLNVSGIESNHRGFVLHSMFARSRTVQQRRTFGLSKKDRGKKIEVVRKCQQKNCSNRTSEGHQFDKVLAMPSVCHLQFNINHDFILCFSSVISSGATFRAGR